MIPDPKFGEMAIEVSYMDKPATLDTFFENVSILMEETGLPVIEIYDASLKVFGQ
jgi:hypothetical protein